MNHFRKISSTVGNLNGTFFKLDLDGLLSAMYLFNPNPTTTNLEEIITSKKVANLPLLYNFSFKSGRFSR